MLRTKKGRHVGREAGRGHWEELEELEELENGDELIDAIHVYFPKLYCLKNKNMDQEGDT